MAALYQLEIVTPMGRKFEGLVDNCVFRSTEGDVGILKGHSPYVAAIETGEIKIHTENGQTRYAAASEGFVHVSSDLVRILVSSCEWAEEIDQARAEASKKRAEEILARKDLDEREYELAQARLKRALVRTSVH